MPALSTPHREKDPVPKTILTILLAFLSASAKGSVRQSFNISYFAQQYSDFLTEWKNLWKQQPQAAIETLRDYSSHKRVLATLAASLENIQAILDGPNPESLISIVSGQLAIGRASSANLVVDYGCASCIPTDQLGLALVPYVEALRDLAYKGWIGPFYDRLKPQIQEQFDPSKEEWVQLERVVWSSTQTKNLEEFERSPQLTIQPRVRFLPHESRGLLHHGLYGLSLVGGLLWDPLLLSDDQRPPPELGSDIYQKLAVVAASVLELILNRDILEVMSGNINDFSYLSYDLWNKDFDDLKPKYDGAKISMCLVKEIVLRKVHMLTVVIWSRVCYLAISQAKDGEKLFQNHHDLFKPDGRLDEFLGYCGEYDWPQEREYDLQKTAKTTLSQLELFRVDMERKVAQLDLTEPVSQLSITKGHQVSAQRRFEIMLAFAKDNPSSSARNPVHLISPFLQAVAVSGYADGKLGDLSEAEAKVVQYVRSILDVTSPKDDLFDPKKIDISEMAPYEVGEVETIFRGLLIEDTFGKPAYQDRDAIGNYLAAYLNLLSDTGNRTVLVERVGLVKNLRDRAKSLFDAGQTEVPEGGKIFGSARDELTYLVLGVQDPRLLLTLIELRRQQIAKERRQKLIDEATKKAELLANTPTKTVADQPKEDPTARKERRRRERAAAMRQVITTNQAEAQRRENERNQRKAAAEKAALERAARRQAASEDRTASLTIPIDSSERYVRRNSKGKRSGNPAKGRRRKGRQSKRPALKSQPMYSEPIGPKATQRLYILPKRHYDVCMSLLDPQLGQRTPTMTQVGDLLVHLGFTSNGDAHPTYTAPKETDAVNLATGKMIKEPLHLKTGGTWTSRGRIHERNNGRHPGRDWISSLLKVLHNAEVSRETIEQLEKSAV